MNKNKSVKVMMSDFITHIAPDAECLYLRDADVCLSSSNGDKLKELGF